MRIVWLSLVAIALTSCLGLTPTSSSLLPSAESEVKMTTKEPNPTDPVKSTALPDLGLAPELENEIWLNTPHPLRISEQRGKVVLLDMWTYG